MLPEQFFFAKKLDRINKICLTFQKGNVICIFDLWCLELLHT